MRFQTAEANAVCFPLRLVISEPRPVHSSAARKGHEGIRLGAKYFRALFLRFRHNLSDGLCHQ